MKPRTRASKPSQSASPRSVRVADAPAKPRRAPRKAAKAIFATSGVDAPVREIVTHARASGVATVYRHFPPTLRPHRCRDDDMRSTRAAAAAPALARKHPPAEALARWLRRYTGFIATKRGLAAVLHSGDPAFDALPGYFRRRLEPAVHSLLKAAVSAGQLRDDIEPDELLQAVASLSTVSGRRGALHGRRMVDLLVDGLRFGRDKSRRR